MNTKLTSVEIAKLRRKQKRREGSREVRTTVEPLEELVDAEAVQVSQRNSYRLFQPRIGEVLTIEETGAEYLLTEKLGKGGGGISFKAEDSEGREKVVKVKSYDESDRANDREGRLNDKFVRLNGILGHLNVKYEAHKVSALQVATIGNFVEGVNLEEYVHEHGVLGEEKVKGLLLQVIEDYIDPIHSRGILHGDLKPANVVVEPSEKVKPIDFGDSKRTDTQTLTTEYRGTFGYAMDMGGDVTREHDVYSLAQLAKFALTGKHPLHFPTERSRDAYNEEEFGELSVSVGFRGILLGMAKGQYSGVNDLSRDLRGLDDVVEAEESGVMVEDNVEDKIGLLKRKESRYKSIRNYLLATSVSSTVIGGTITGLTQDPAPAIVLSLFLGGGIGSLVLLAEADRRSTKKEMVRLEEKLEEVKNYGNAKVKLISREVEVGDLMGSEESVVVRVKELVAVPTEDVVEAEPVDNKELEENMLSNYRTAKKLRNFALGGLGMGGFGTLLYAISYHVTKGNTLPAGILMDIGLGIAGLSYMKSLQCRFKAKDLEAQLVEAKQFPAPEGEEEVEVPNSQPEEITEESEVKAYAKMGWHLLTDRNLRKYFWEIHKLSDACINNSESMEDFEARIEEIENIRAKTQYANESPFDLDNFRAHKAVGLAKPLRDELDSGVTYNRESFWDTLREYREFSRFSEKIDSYLYLKRWKIQRLIDEIDRGIQTFPELGVEFWKPFSKRHKYDIYSNRLKELPFDEGVRSNINSALYAAQAGDNKQASNYFSRITSQVKDFPEIEMMVKDIINTKEVEEQ